MHIEFKLLLTEYILCAKGFLNTLHAFSHSILKKLFEVD